MILFCLGCGKQFTGTHAAEGFCALCKAKLSGVPEVKVPPVKPAINIQCESCRQLFEIPRECPACRSG